MAEFAGRQLDMAQAQYDDYRNIDMPWMRGIAEESLGISRSNAERAGALSDYQLESMRFNDNRYRDVAIPFENQLLEDVNRFDSAGYKDQQVASAMADVQSGFSGAAEQQRRGLARMGVNPNSGRSMAMGNSMGFEQAKAMANAANKTRMAADQVGLSTKMQMYGGMRGLAGLGATSAGLATNAMGMGNASAGGMTGAAGSYLNANNANFAGAQSGMASGIQGLGSFTSLGQKSAEINNASDPMGTLVGAAAGMGSAYLTGGLSAMGSAAGKSGTGIFSDRRLKTDIEAIGKLDNGLTVYRYRYKAGGPMLLGVMADEVAVLKPEAYIPNVVGDFAAVDYAKL
jgi:hypothetical protein